MIGLSITKSFFYAPALTVEHAMVPASFLRARELPGSSCDRRRGAPFRSVQAVGLLRIRAFFPENCRPAFSVEKAGP